MEMREPMPCYRLGTNLRFRDGDSPRQAFPGDGFRERQLFFSKPRKTSGLPLSTAKRIGRDSEGGTSIRSTLQLKLSALTHVLLLSSHQPPTSHHLSTVQRTTTDGISSSDTRSSLSSRFSYMRGYSDIASSHASA
ncbi:hypothetical protein HGRIS_005358 [Hohenbuehelia grisea]|uniref:Uncharacterized protein n=1 Tax=Hohenbuehelia grisea TaxID=104357 RepID=A0ABR3JER7_9AGAR